MEKLLICSGDSFTDQAFRSASHPDIDTSWPKWPEILAKKLGMRCINLGNSGFGNEYIYSSIQDVIENIKDKNKIGLVIAGWSQCFRIDFERGSHWYTTCDGYQPILDDPYEKGRLREQSWDNLRVNPNGDIFGWVKKSLRIYKNFEYMCEYYNIPYFQTQMIPMYVDWLRGLPLTEELQQQNELTVEEAWAQRMQYPGNARLDERKILKLLTEYDSILNSDKFIGWPISRKLGGYCLVGKFVGYAPGSPYVVSDYDGHPNKEGQQRLAEAIYKHIKEK